MNDPAKLSKNGVKMTDLRLTYILSSKFIPTEIYSFPETR